MLWIVELAEEFELEFRGLAESVRKDIASRSDLLEQHGPQLGRPYVDTLEGSRHANMKELRFKSEEGVWRVAFAFDPRRHAILLIAGDKRGVNQKRFYSDLISRADARYDRHLEMLRNK